MDTINTMRIIIAIPAFNEEKVIAETLRALHAYCSAHLPKTNEWEIVVADNKSSDHTKEKVMEIARSLDRIQYQWVPRRGKGEAVLSVWEKRKHVADIFLFIDADLAPHPSAVPRLVRAVAEGKDIAVGSRMVAGSSVSRPFIRTAVSALFSFFRRALFRSGVKDSACGIKAVNKKTVHTIVPRIKNRKWFFDTELVLRAEKEKYHVAELPIQWSDREIAHGKSKINIASVSIQYLLALVQLKREFLKRR